MQVIPDWKLNRYKCSVCESYDSVRYQQDDRYYCGICAVLNTKSPYEQLEIRVLSDLSDMFCPDNCPALSPTEGEQGHSKEHHICSRYGRRVIHGDYHPKILKCKPCREGKPPESRLEVSLFLTDGTELHGCLIYPTSEYKHSLDDEYTLQEALSKPEPSMEKYVYFSNQMIYEGRIPIDYIQLYLISRRTAKI